MLEMKKDSESFAKVRVEFVVENDVENVREHIKVLDHVGDKVADG